MSILSKEQREDAQKISQKIRQFRVLWDYWHGEGINLNCEMTLFHMEEMAREILGMVRRHVREYNLHEGITVDLLEKLQ